MNQIRYEELLKRRIQKSGYVRFASHEKTLHSEMLKYVNEQIMTSLAKDAFRNKDSGIFLISVSMHDVYIRTLHKYVEIVKCFKATNADNIPESLDLLTRKLASYGLAVVPLPNYNFHTRSKHSQELSVLVLTDEELKMNTWNLPTDFF